MALEHLAADSDEIMAIDVIAGLRAQNSSAADLSCAVSSEKGGRARTALADIGGSNLMLTDLIGTGPIPAGQVAWLVSSQSDQTPAVQGMTDDFDGPAFLAAVKSAGIRLTTLQDRSVSLTLPAGADTSRLQDSGFGAFLQSSFRYLPAERVLVKYGFDVDPASALSGTGARPPFSATELAGTGQAASAVTGIAWGTRSCGDPWASAPSPTLKALFTTVLGRPLPYTGVLEQWSGADADFTVRLRYASAANAQDDRAGRRANFRVARDTSSPIPSTAHLALRSLQVEGTDLLYRITAEDESFASLALLSGQGAIWSLCRKSD